MKLNMPDLQENVSLVSQNIAGTESKQVPFAIMANTSACALNKRLMQTTGNKVQPVTAGTTDSKDSRTKGNKNSKSKAVQEPTKASTSAFAVNKKKTQSRNLVSNALSKSNVQKQNTENMIEIDSLSSPKVCKNEVGLFSRTLKKKLLAETGSDIAEVFTNQESSITPFRMRGILETPKMNDGNGTEGKKPHVRDKQLGYIESIGEFMGWMDDEHDFTEEFMAILKVRASQFLRELLASGKDSNSIIQLISANPRLEFLRPDLLQSREMHSFLRKV